MFDFFAANLHLGNVTFDSGVSTSLSIGILDMFGFEVMHRNSLKQVCINLTNEMLLQQYIKYVFELEQERYAREGTAVSSVEF